MTDSPKTELLSIETSQEIIEETNAWQLARIQDGLEASEAGRVKSANDVFDEIAAKHGWSR